MSSRSVSIDVVAAAARLLVTANDSWWPRHAVAVALMLTHAPVFVHCCDTIVVDTAVVTSRATTLTLLRLSTHATRIVNCRVFALAGTAQRCCNDEVSCRRAANVPVAPGEATVALAP